MKYPAGFFPRDDLSDHSEQLDWHGDHPHTNYHGMYDSLKKAGYFVEVLEVTLLALMLNSMAHY